MRLAQHWTISQEDVPMLLRDEERIRRDVLGSGKAMVQFGIPRDECEGAIDLPMCCGTSTCNFYVLHVSESIFFRAEKGFLISYIFQV